MYIVGKQKFVILLGIVFDFLFITLLNHGKVYLSAFNLFPHHILAHRYEQRFSLLLEEKTACNKKTMKHTLKPRKCHTFWTLTFYLINNNGVVYLWDLLDIFIFYFKLQHRAKQKTTKTSKDLTSSSHHCSLLIFKIKIIWENRIG